MPSVILSSASSKTASFLPVAGSRGGTQHLGRDLAQRHFDGDSAAQLGHPRHAVDDAALLVLTDRPGAGRPHRRHARRPARPMPDKMTPTAPGPATSATELNSTS